MKSVTEVYKQIMRVFIALFLLQRAVGKGNYAQYCTYLNRALIHLDTLRMMGWPSGVPMVREGDRS